MSDRDRTHPREKKDRAVIDLLLTEDAKNNDYNLLELARLIIRYKGFPGARDIQQDLENILNKWELTEEELYQKTRAIYADDNPYSEKFKGDTKQDWT